MRIVHTSDWHAGRLWKRIDRLPELANVLENLRPFLSEVDLPLRSGEDRALEVSVSHNQIDGLLPETTHQMRDDLSHPLVVLLPNPCLFTGKVEGTDQTARGRERDSRHAGSLTGFRFDLHEAAVIQAPRKSDGLYVYEFGQRTPCLKPRRTIVVPGDDHGLDAGEAHRSE